MPSRCLWVASGFAEYDRCRLYTFDSAHAHGNDVDETISDAGGVPRPSWKVTTELARTHHEPKAPTAKLRPKSECAFCHQASAKKNEVWTQFYRLLD
jgi:hypothetical protein